MATFEEVLQLLQSGKSVELKFHLNSIMFSRHELFLVDGKIEDFSYVDNSTTTYSVSEYRRSFYGKAFNKSTVEIDEVYDKDHQPINYERINTVCQK